MQSIVPATLFSTYSFNFINRTSTGDPLTTVRDETHDLMRKLGLTTVFGNPGSTEETFLKDFPSDFNFVLALQEASVLAIADGFAQATRTVAFVNVHTAPGLGNTLGNLVNSHMSKTPMILTTGQQTREMLLMEPWLTNVDATEFPKPHVKWSYQTSHAQETPAAFMRAFAVASQPPQGPAYLSLPLDDWDQESSGPAVVRTVATRVAPDPARLSDFAGRLKSAKNPALVIGPDVDRADAWPQAIALADKLGIPVFGPPGGERCGFPENHPQFAGNLKFAIGPLSEQLTGHDLVLVIGAPVFRYYPYVPGKYLPDGCQLLQITDDPEEAGRSPVGDSLVSNAKLALQGLLPLLEQYQTKSYKRPAETASPIDTSSSPMSVDAFYAAVSRVRPDDAVIVEESPSNLATLHKYLPTRKPLSFFTMASGGLGWGLPGGIGVALGERKTGRNRPVIDVVGDGSFQYSIQSLWTAAQQKARIVILVPVNEEYAILKAFAKQEDTPGVPALDIPGIDIAGLGAAYGCKTSRASTPDEVSDQLKAALEHDGPTVIAAKISNALPPLL